MVNRIAAYPSVFRLSELRQVICSRLLDTPTQGGCYVCSKCFLPPQARSRGGIHPASRQERHSRASKTKGVPRRNRLHRSGRGGRGRHQCVGSERERRGV